MPACRCLFEDGQRLAALAGVEQTESELQRGGGAGPLSALVAAAGQACMAAVAGSGERDPRAVFYSSPTATVAQFFKSVVGAVAGVGKQAGRAGADHQAVVMLSRAVTAALNGALHQRQAQQQLFPTALNAAVAGLDEPELAAGPDVRLALGALADACCRCAAATAASGAGARADCCCWRLSACLRAPPSWRGVAPHNPCLPCRAGSSPGCGRRPRSCCRKTCCCSSSSPVSGTCWMMLTNALQCCLHVA